MITKFDNYIEESVRDKMTPKSEEDIRKFLKSKNPYKMLELAMSYNIPWAAEEAIRRGVLKNYDWIVPFIRWFVYNDYTDIAELAVDNGLKLSKDDLYILNNEIIIGDKVDLLKLFINKELISPKNIISYAIGSGSDKIVKYLLDLDVEIKQEDLEKAIRNGNNEITELLISKVKIEPWLLRLAISLGRPRIVEILLKAGLYYDDAISDANNKKNKKIVRLLNQYK